MKILALLLKRPSDKQIKISKILLGLILILLAVIAFRVQNLSLQDSFLGLALDTNSKIYLSYAILGLWVIPIVLWGLDINLLSRGRTRILQIVFWVFLMILSGVFIDAATLSVDIFYFLLGLIIAFIWITGKFITKKGLKTGQKITKIRV